MRKREKGMVEMRGENMCELIYLRERAAQGMSSLVLRVQCMSTFQINKLDTRYLTPLGLMSNTSVF